MVKLSDILYKAGIIDVKGSTSIPITKVCSASGEVVKNYLFIAIKGTQQDGHKYIDEAINSGCCAVVCEKMPEKINEKVTYIKVKNSSAALGYIASNFYDTPSARIKLVGVTGTNGKTTSVTLLFNLFKTLGYKAGLLSTVINRIDNEEF